jgi:hypothetical protein
MRLPAAIDAARPSIGGTASAIEARAAAPPFPADHGLSRGWSARGSIRSQGNIPSEWRPPKCPRQDGDANLGSKEKSGALSQHNCRPVVCSLAAGEEIDMPYTVQTEAARVAIAHRERDAEIERINGQIDARLRELAVAQGYVVGPNALVKLASDDVVIRRLILEQVVREHVCERLISGGYVPIIELGEPGEPARWRPPDSISHD